MPFRSWGHDIPFGELCGSFTVQSRLAVRSDSVLRTALRFFTTSKLGEPLPSGVNEVR